MFSIKNQLLIVLLLCHMPCVYAQEQVSFQEDPSYNPGRFSDTLAMSGKLRDLQQYEDACALLYQYLRHHPEDVNALWLCAQTELWRGHPGASKKLYAAAAALAPANDYLVLDYAAALADMREWKRATGMLERLEAQGRVYSSGLMTRANILYWSAAYAEARKITEQVRAREPDHKAARDLNEKIRLAQAPWIRLSAAYVSDNQPLQTIKPLLEAGMFRHRLLAPFVSVYTPVFTEKGRNSGVQQVEAGNQFLFPHAGMKLRLSGGATHFAYGNTGDWTGSVSVRQKKKYFFWEADAERKPYLFTTTSLDTAVSYGHFSGGAGWSRENGIEGKIAAELNAFRGGNYVYTLYGWLYAPPMNFSIFTLRLGYSYSYSDAKENSFIYGKSLAEAIAGYNEPLKGMYHIYFTPEQQHIHAALLSCRVRASGRLEFGFNMDAGLMAWAQNPYLYLDKNDRDEIYIAKGFDPQKFSPFGISVFANWQLSPEMYLSADYQYRQTWFFTTNQVGLGLKINFPDVRSIQ